MKQSFIRVLGSADWHQTAYNDHSCYTICDKILIDACPSVITQLLEHDVDPLGIRTRVLHPHALRSLHGAGSAAALLARMPGSGSGRVDHRRAQGHRAQICDEGHGFLFDTHITSA